MIWGVSVLIGSNLHTSLMLIDTCRFGEKFTAISVHFSETSHILHVTTAHFYCKRMQLLKWPPYSPNLTGLMRSQHHNFTQIHLPRLQVIHCWHIDWWPDQSASFKELLAWAKDRVCMCDAARSDCLLRKQHGHMVCWSDWLKSDCDRQGQTDGLSNHRQSIFLQNTCPFSNSF